jgi:predicted metal-dependent hydrolase
LILVERFVKEKLPWILEKIIKIKKNNQNNSIIKYTPEDYLKNKLKALEFVKKRIEYFNQTYNFVYNQIFIKNQKTRWGSCSNQRNMNFNWRLLMMPSEILDYCVVHELAHTLEMNHSKNFWKHVSKEFPEYKESRKFLRENAEKFRIE